MPNVDALSPRQVPARPDAFGSFPNDSGTLEPGDGPVDYAAIQRSPAFVDLRRRRMGFVLPATIAFFAWYMTYVLLAAYAPGFMAEKVWGQINIGLVLGMLQFASTVLITTWYTRFARRVIDPRVDAIRQHAGEPTS